MPRDADAEPVRRARRLGPGRAGHHLQPRLRVSCADDEALILELDPDDRRAVGRELLHPRRGTSRSTTRRGSPAATTGRSSPTTTDSCASCSPGVDPGTANWLDTEGRTEVLTTVRWFRPPETPHDRSRGRAARAIARCAPARRPPARRRRRPRAPRSPSPRRARRLEVPHMSDRQLGRRARRHRDRRVEGRRARHRAAPRPARRVARDHRPASRRRSSRLAAELDRHRRAAPVDHAQRRRPRRRVRARRAHDRRVRPGRRAGRQRADVPVGHPVGRDHRARHGRAVEHRAEGHAVGHAGGVPAHARPGAGPHRHHGFERGAARARRGTRPYASSKEAIRGTHPLGGARVGQARDHRQLPVPGVGRAPHAAGRRRPGAGADVRRDLRQPADPA